MTRLSFFFQEAHYKKNYSLRVSCIKSEVHTKIFRLSRCLKVEGFACCFFFWRKMRERKSFFKRRELCKWARDKDTLPQWPKEKPPRQDARNVTKKFREVFERGNVLVATRAQVQSPLLPRVFEEIRLLFLTKSQRLFARMDLEASRFLGQFVLRQREGEMEEKHLVFFVMD